MTVLIMLAGGLGAVARFVADALVRARWRSSGPWATWLINVSGSLLLGALAGWSQRGGGATAEAVAGVGFCGGFTTFSTSSFETVRLIENRSYRTAFANMFALLAISFACCAGGWYAVVHL